MKNRKAKRMIFNSATNGRKLFWFGERSEVFVASDIDEVISLNREWIGDDDVDDHLCKQEFGEIDIITDVNYWFSFGCKNEDSGKIEPIINIFNGSGCYQVSSAYF